MKWDVNKIEMKNNIFKFQSAFWLLKIETGLENMNKKNTDDLFIYYYYYYNFEIITKFSLLLFINRKKNNKIWRLK